MWRRSFLAGGAFLALPAVLAVAGSGARRPHPHFDDQGTLTWYSTLSEAMDAARTQGKVILLECGRRRCVQCRKLCSQVLPDPRVRDRVSRIAVGLASNCDAMEPAITRMVQSRLPNANMLPYVGFLRSDGVWITGFAGGRTVDAFLSDLSHAERSLSLERQAAAARTRRAAAPVARQAVSAAGPQASVASGAKTRSERIEEAEGRGAWDEVVRLCRDCDPEDPCARRTMARARAWAETRLGAARKAAEEARYDDARALVEPVRKAFDGEPEAEEAGRGLAAIRKAEAIRDLPDETAGVARRHAREDFQATRWASLFE